MDENKHRKSKGITPVKMFFLFAIAIVAAFLIVGIVKTCSSDHQEQEVQEQVQMPQ